MNFEVYSGALLRYRNSGVSKVKSIAKINLKWVSQLGTHWTKHGMIAPKHFDGNRWRIRPLLSFLAQAILLVKLISFLSMDSYQSREMAIWYGDLFALAATTHASWFYCNLMHIIGCIYSGGFYLQVALQKESSNEKSDLKWLRIVEEVRDGHSCRLFNTKAGQKFVKFTAALCKFLSLTMPLLFAFYAFCVSLPYCFEVTSYPHYLLWLLYGFQYFIFVQIIGMLVAIKAAYFLWFCLYFSYKLIRICEKLSKAIHFNIRLARKYAMLQVQAMTACLALISSSNAYFGQKLKPLLATLFFGFLAYLYAFPTSTALSEKFFLGFGIVFIFFTIVFFFTSASLIKRKLNLCYRVLSRLQLKRISFRANWSVLLMLEMIGSKRKKVGFEVKDWCKLNNWSLLKVAMITSSIYFLMVKFGKEF